MATKGQLFCLAVFTIGMLGFITYQSIDRHGSGRYIISQCGDMYRLQSRGETERTSNYNIQERRWSDNGSSWWANEESYQTREAALKRCKDLRGY